MFYQVDGSRLLVLLVLLGAGMFIASRLVSPTLPSHERAASSPRRIGLRGMWLMTLLGLGSGVGGGLLENVAGETALVGVLHSAYRVCWAPAFLMAELQKALAGSGASSRFTADLLGLLGLLLIPVLWFVIFFCAGKLLARSRRAGHHG